MTRGQEQNLVGFCLDGFHTNESLSTFFLELLWSDSSTGDDSSAWPNSRDLERYTSAITKWKQAGKPIRILPKLYEPEAPNFVFSRMWYAHSLAVLDHKEGAELGYLPIPSFEGDTDNGINISGNWYLGILKGSINPKRALRTLQWMTNAFSDYHIFRTRASLPAHSYYWEKALIPQQIKTLYTQAKSRCVIKDFYQISPILADGMSKLLETSDLYPTRIQALVTDMQSQISRKSRS